MQEEFVLKEVFEIAGSKQRAIKYKSDFIFYENDKLAKVVDVKGKCIANFNIKVRFVYEGVRDIANISNL